MTTIALTLQPYSPYWECLVLAISTYWYYIYINLAFSAAQDYRMVFSMGSISTALCNGLHFNLGIDI